MRILVTGGAGFIGSHLVEFFHDKADVRVLDNLRTGHRRNLEPFDVDFVEGSILDRSLLDRLMEGVDYVFHLGAFVSVPESVRCPAECIETNTLGTMNVLESAAAAGVRKLCFSSSCALYGDVPELPKHESMLPAPTSPYAISKLSGEHFCRMFTEQGRLETAALRYFNVFGPRQDPDSPYAAVVPAFITRALGGEPLRIFGDGTQTRDFVYVKDVVRANVHLAVESDATGVLNVAYDSPVAIRRLARLILDLTGSDSGIEYAPARPGDVQHSRAGIGQLEATGFRPAFTFKGGLEETVAAFTGALTTANSTTSGND